jgi:cytidine deaminase
MLLRVICTPLPVSNPYIGVYVVKKTYPAFNGDKTKHCYHNKGMHAERSALLKWIRGRRNNRGNVDLLVIRTNKDGTLRDSKPCHHCLKFMMYVSRYGLYVNEIHYSTGDGVIVRKTLRDLWNENQHHVSSGFRHRN